VHHRDNHSPSIVYTAAILNGRCCYRCHTLAPRFDDFLHARLAWAEIIAGLCHRYVSALDVIDLCLLRGAINVCICFGIRRVPILARQYELCHSAAVAVTSQHFGSAIRGMFSFI
jgi:hypothetical protein